MRIRSPTFFFAQPSRPTYAVLFADELIYRFLKREKVQLLQQPKNGRILRLGIDTYICKIFCIRRKSTNLFYKKKVLHSRTILPNAFQILLAYLKMHQNYLLGKFFYKLIVLFQHNYLFSSNKSRFQVKENIFTQEYLAKPSNLLVYEVAFRASL